MNISNTNNLSQIQSTAVSGGSQSASSRPQVSHSNERPAVTATLLWRSNSTPHWGVEFKIQQAPSVFVPLETASSNDVDNCTDPIHGREVIVHAEWPQNRPEEGTARLDVHPGTLHLDLSAFEQQHGKSFSNFIQNYTPVPKEGMRKLPAEMKLNIAELLPFDSLKSLRRVSHEWARMAGQGINHLRIRNANDFKFLLEKRNKPLATAAGCNIKKITFAETHYLSSKNWITDTRMKKFGAEIKAIFPTFVELELQGCQKITDIVVQHLQPLQDLQRLSLTYCRLTDSALEHFKPSSDGTQPFSSLTHLDLSGCVQITATEHLRHLSALQYVRLNGCNRITDLAPFLDLHGLKTLKLDACDNIGPSVRQHLEHLTGLESLSLGSCKLNDAQLQKLEHLSAHLKHLCLSFTTLSDSVMKAIAALKLKTLDLYGCKLSSTGMARLRELDKTLESLDLTFCVQPGNNRPRLDLSVLPTLTKLTTLSLGNIDLQNADFQRLQLLPNLKRLTLRGNDAVDDHVLQRHIFPLQNLTVLNINQCRKLTSASIPHLLRLPNLDTLRVDECNFTANDLSTLRAGIRNVIG